MSLFSIVGELASTPVLSWPETVTKLYKRAESNGIAQFFFFFFFSKMVNIFCNCYFCELWISEGQNLLFLALHP